MRKKRHHFGRGWTRTPPPERCPLCGAKLVPVVVTLERGEALFSSSDRVKLVKTDRSYLTYSDLAVHLRVAHKMIDSCVCAFKLVVFSDRNWTQTAQALGEHLKALGDELSEHLIFYSLGKKP